MRIQLQLLNGEKIERTIEVDRFVIGRSNKCDVVVPHEGMSRQHCQIELVNGEVFITDLGSTNGVLIDGERIEPHKRTLYATYLTLAFGAVQSMQITLVEPTKSIHITPSAPKKDNKELPAMAGNSNTATKTKPATELPKQTNAQIPRPGKPSSFNFRSMLINVFGIAILGAAIWWFMQKEDPSATAPHEADAPVELVE